MMDGVGYPVVYLIYLYYMAQVCVCVCATYTCYRTVLPAVQYTTCYEGTVNDFGVILREYNSLLES